MQLVKGTEYALHHVPHILNVQDKTMTQEVQPIVLAAPLILFPY